MKIFHGKNSIRGRLDHFSTLVAPSAILKYWLFLFFRKGGGHFFPLVPCNFLKLELIQYGDCYNNKKLNVFSVCLCVCVCLSLSLCVFLSCLCLSIRKGCIAPTPPLNFRKKTFCAVYFCIPWCSHTKYVNNWPKPSQNHPTLISPLPPPPALLKLPLPPSLPQHISGLGMLTPRHFLLWVH